jgi:hypothetical protein
MRVQELKIGMEVTYLPRNGNKEVGIVTSWNNSFVFVDYDGFGRGKATRIQDLVQGNQTFHCADEWNSVMDGAFGRCGRQCLKCSGK